MINPGAIPQVPGDLDALAAHAAALQATGAGFADTGARVHATFQGLAPHYAAPEAGLLFATTQPVATVSADIGEDVTAIGAALASYVETVRPIKARLEALRGQAESFVADVAGKDDWQDDDAKVEQHDGMLSAVNSAVAEWQAAERACANAVLALYSDRRWRADDGDGRLESGEHGYTAAQLNAAAGQGLPWGTPEADDGGFLGVLWSGVKGIVVDGAWGDVLGLVSLVGLSTSGWSFQTMKDSWGGLANLTVFGYVDEVVGGEMSPWEATTTVWGNWGEVGKGVVAWDQWDDNPARAGGQLIYNVVTLPIAVTKAAKGAGAVGHAADAGRAAGTAGDAGRISRIGRGVADTFTRMPTVDEIARNAARKFNIPLPHFGPAPAIAGDAPVGGHRFDVETPAPRGPDTTHTNTGPGRDSAPPPERAMSQDAGRAADPPPPRGAPEGSAAAASDPGKPPDTPTGSDPAGGTADPNSHRPDRESAPERSPALADAAGDSSHRPKENPGSSMPGDPPGGTVRDDPSPGGQTHPSDPVAETHQRLSPADDTSGHPTDHTTRDTSHGDSTDHDAPGQGDRPGEDQLSVGKQPDGSWIGEEHGQRMKLDPAVNGRADNILKQAAANEPRISAAVKDVTAHVDHAKPQGWDFRLKGEGSLKRKIFGDLMETPNPDRVLSKLNDNIRYTMELPPSHYADGARQAIEQLKAHGFQEVKVKNFWSRNLGVDDYKGINSVWRDPTTGQTFEMQWHTPASFEAKEAAHQYYEAARVPGATDTQVAAAKAKAVAIFRELTDPPGAAQIREVNGARPWKDPSYE